MREIVKRTRPICLSVKNELKNQKKKMNAEDIDNNEKKMRQQSFRSIAQSYIDAVKAYQEAQSQYEEPYAARWGDG